MKFNIKLKLTTGPSSLAVIDKTSRPVKQTAVSSPSVQRAFFVVKNTIVLVLVWFMSQILVWLKISPVLLSKFYFLSTFKSLKIMFPSLWKTFLYLTLRQRWNMVGLEHCPSPAIWLAFEGTMLSHWLSLIAHPSLDNWWNLLVVTVTTSVQYKTRISNCNFVWM